MGPGEKKEGKEGPPDLKSVSLGVKGTCGSSAGSPPYRGDHQPPPSWGAALLQLLVQIPLPNAWSLEPPTMAQPGPPAMRQVPC